MRRFRTVSGSNRVRLKKYYGFKAHLQKATVCLIPNRSFVKMIAVSVIHLTALNQAQAAGFAVLEQSVLGLGNIYSGGTAGGEDISTIFYNPAGLSEYVGTEIISGAHFAIPEARFKVDSSSDILNRPLTGGDGGNAGENVLIPNLYLATDLTGPFRLGLGITVPFGLGTKYNNDWKGRYEAINSQLKTIDINPAVSYVLNDKVSLGFGLSAQYIDVELSNAIDFGTICIEQLSAAACSVIGLSPQASDGEVELKADGWSWGYNVGILVKPISDVRLGIAYRSRVNHRVKGNAKFQIPASAQPLTATGSFRDTDIWSESDVPANLAFGAIYESNEKWAMLLDITWTQWGRLDSLTINFDNPSQPPSTLNLDFKNTIRASLGFIYHMNSVWSIRSGFAYDESPVRNARTRTFRIPDSDRYWLGVGVGYQPNTNLKINLSYGHVFLRDALIESEDSFGHTLIGSFESKINIVSAELQWTF